jgi:hypothetical protein
MVETVPSLARPAVDKISALYGIKTVIRGRMSDCANLKRTSPLLVEMKTWLETTLMCISGRGEFAKAIRYASSRWDAPDDTEHGIPTHRQRQTPREALSLPASQCDAEMFSQSPQPRRPPRERADYRHVEPLNEDSLMAILQ